MPSKKKPSTGSDGVGARRRGQSMPGAAGAEMPAVSGMSGEEEMPGSGGWTSRAGTEIADEMDVASAVAAMTGGDMPSGEMSSADEESGDPAVASPDEEVTAAEEGRGRSGSGRLRLRGESSRRPTSRLPDLPR